DVVNGEIGDDPDAVDTEREWSDPGGRDGEDVPEEPRIETPLHLLQSGVEPLDVPDRSDQGGGAERVPHGLCPADVRGQGLLDESVDAGPGQPAGCLLVARGRGAEDHWVAAGSRHVVERMEESVPAKGSRDATGGTGSPHELAAIHAGQDAHMMTA